MIERSERNDITENALAAEPIDPTDANDPIEPMEHALPTEPIERNESFEAIERNEFSDRHESFEFLPSDMQQTYPARENGCPPVR